MDGTWDHHAKWSEPCSEGQRSYVFPHMWMLKARHKR
jgi:hypothetical protein